MSDPHKRPTSVPLQISSKLEQTIPNFKSKRAWSSLGTPDNFNYGLNSGRSNDSSFSGEVDSIIPRKHSAPASVMYNRSNSVNEAWNDLVLESLEDDDDNRNYSDVIIQEEEENSEGESQEEEDDDGNESQKNESQRKREKIMERKKFGKQVEELSQMIDDLQRPTNDVSIGTRNNKRPKNSSPQQEQLKNVGKLPIRKRIDQRVNQLVTNPEELEKLETSIAEYDARMKQRFKEALEEEGQEDKVRKNKNLAEYNLRMQAGRQKKQNLRKQRMVQAKARKRKLEEDIMERKERIARKEEIKQEKAKKAREEAIFKAHRVEKQIRWGFLVSLCSRTQKLETDFMAERKRRERLAKNFMAMATVHSRLMPIVKRRRVRRCDHAWQVFKKHWVMYRLWMSVKNKRRAAQTIVSFLQDCRKAMTYPKRVHYFLDNVKKVQLSIKNHVTKRRTQTMLLCLQYTNMEDTLLTLSKQRVAEINDQEETDFNDIILRMGRKNLIQLTESDQENFHFHPASNSSQQEPSLDVSNQTLPKMLPPPSSPVKLENAALDLKMELVIKDVIKRVKGDEDSSHFKFILSDERMAHLCLKGFVQLRILERDIVQRAEEALSNERERKRYLEHYERNYSKKLAKGNEIIASFFKDILFSDKTDVTSHSRSLMYPKTD